MKPYFSISAKMFLRLSCLVLFMVFVLASFFSVRNVTHISELSGKVRREQLPRIVESQRAFVNVEGLRRIAEVIYLSGDREARRKARINAQALAADSLYFTDREFHARALQAAKDIARLTELRDTAEDHGRRMRVVAGLYERELLLTVHHVSNEDLKRFFQAFYKTSMYTTGGLDLVPSGMAALKAQQESDAELSGWIGAECERYASSEPEFGQSCSNLAKFYAEYDTARTAMLGNLAAATAQWEQIDLYVREMRDAIGSGSERNSDKALGEIENLSDQAVRNSLFFGVISLSTFLLFLLLLKKNILQPLHWNAGKLQEIRSGGTIRERRNFALREIEAISEMLDSFSSYLAELYEQQDQLKLDSEQMGNLEQIMRAVFKASVDGYCVWSPSELRLVNRQMLVLLGCDSSPYSEGPFRHPSDLPFSRPGELYEKVIETGLMREECTLEDLAGNSLPVEITSLPVRLSTGIYVFSYFRDLRRQKEYERNLREAKEEAEAAAAAKTAFMARMGHEIRTPLNGVLGLTQVALTKSPSCEQKQYLERIAGSAMILLQVIKDILDFSNLGEGEYKLENNIFSMRETLSTVADSISPQAREKGLVFKVYVEQSMPDSFYGDYLRLAQVLLNLCDNAVKFTQEGSVTLQVHYAFVQQAAASAGSVRALDLPGFVNGSPSGFLAGPQGGAFSKPDLPAHKSCELRFIVSDTGIGIPPEKQDEIFQPFEQADGSCTRLHGGMGLGLSIARRLVRMMGGELTVISTPGHGSSFSFTLRMPNISPDAFSGHAAEAGLTVGGESCGAGAISGNEVPPESNAVPGVNSTPAAEHEESASVPPVPQAAAGAATDAESEESDPRGILRERRALLVEDNPLNQEIALSLLEDVGMSVLVADNGAAALEYLAGNDVDIVLMDIQMPVMDGLTATSCIRGHEREQVRRLPVLAVTAQSLPEECERCYAAGMNDHVAKPLNAEELYSKMALWIGRAEGWQG